MKLGPLRIHLYKKNAAGLEIYPWQALTTDRLSPEVRALVAKMARAEARTALAEHMEAQRAEIRQALHTDVLAAVHAFRDHVGTILPGVPAQSEDEQRNV